MARAITDEAAIKAANTLYEYCKQQRKAAICGCCYLCIFLEKGCGTCKLDRMPIRYTQLGGEKK